MLNTRTTHHAHTSTKQYNQQVLMTASLPHYWCLFIDHSPLYALIIVQHAGAISGPRNNTQAHTKQDATTWRMPNVHVMPATMHMTHTNKPVTNTHSFLFRLIDHHHSNGCMPVTGIGHISFLKQTASSHPVPSRQSFNQRQ